LVIELAVVSTSIFDWKLDIKDLLSDIFDDATYLHCSSLLQFVSSLHPQHVMNLNFKPIEYLRLQKIK